METTIEKQEAPATKREFVGRVWENIVQEGEHKGTIFFNIRIDQTIKKVTLTPDSKVQLWPNKKRDGKKDADYRMSIVLPEEDEKKQV